MSRRLMVTGGAGFIGSALVRMVVGRGDAEVLNVDSLTYAGNLDSLEPIRGNSRHHFERVDVCDGPRLRSLFTTFRPDAVIHLAAESHVDRSIDGPVAFLQTNVVGTFTLLQESLRYFRSLPGVESSRFRFLHVSTDEVFGDLEATGYFTETTPYHPSSPYSASKAASDHFVHAWHRTYGLPVLTTNCSNNYGPYQFPEKLIPLMILNGLEGKRLPVYGSGSNVRDWLFVDDHAEALLAVLEKGHIGETYLISGRAERTNLDVVHTICGILDDLRPNGAPHRRLINFVTDRPGHDHRYAIDPTKIETTIGWRPRERFDTGLRRTVQWYLENPTWWERIRSGAYRGERLGLGVGGAR